MPLGRHGRLRGIDLAGLPFKQAQGQKSLFSNYPILVLKSHRAQRLKKPGAHIIIGYYLYKTQNVLIAQTHLSKCLNILRVTGIGCTSYLDREVGNFLFPWSQVGLGKISCYLFRQLRISGLSTEGRQMAGSSVFSPVVG